jgi:hypothetical protein
MDHALQLILQSDTNVHHVLSFDNLLSVHLPDIIAMYGKVTTLLKTVKYTLSITNVVSSPTRPSTSNCHQFGLNYLFCVRGTVSLLKENQVIQSAHIPLAYIPLMTGRGILSQDQELFPESFSGLFVSKGKCRTIPPSKNLLYNTQILSIKNDVHTLQVRSAHKDKIYRSTSTFDMLIDDMGNITCKLPFQPTGIPLRVLVIALGSDPKEFYDYMIRVAGKHYDESIFCALKVSLFFDHKNVHTQLEGVMFVSNLFGKSMESTGLNVLKNELFPHVGREFVAKVHYLCLCAVRLFLFAHDLVPETSRDDYAVSQITTSAGHLGSMFRLLFIGHMRTCGRLLRRMLNKSTTDLAVV